MVYLSLVAQSERSRASLFMALAAVLVLTTIAVALRRRGTDVQLAGSGGQPTSASVRMGSAGAPPPANLQMSYEVAPGDTLSLIAQRFGTTVEELQSLNGIRNPDSLHVGQELQLHLEPDHEGPALEIIPDSELVYGPAYVGFETADFVASYDQGYLSNYSEMVDGRPMSGAAIVERIAREFSVGPRVLLSFVEARSGWVTGQPMDLQSVDYPAGLIDPVRSGLWWQLSWLADTLNSGYYDWTTRGNRLLRMTDGTVLAGSTAIGPGSFAIHRALAHQSTEAELTERLVEVAAAYRTLFGSPWERALEPVDPAAIEFPALQLPWPEGESWWFTGGPHGGWANGSAWAALDFVPHEDARGCFVSARWATAAADGVVIDAGEGQLWLDLDGDGRRETGPALLYLHLATEERVPGGTHVKAGDPLGHPSCEGGASSATHLHLARTYDGAWLAASSQCPLVLGNWRAEAAPAAYDGRLVGSDGRERTACECREPGYNDVSW